ncbi:hypothetical protein PHLH7_41570 [Pseudomonas sp. Ost2]|nr:hypothetical protein PHLH7_41570 [Pseudomonas sp. Ost2]
MSEFLSHLDIDQQRFAYLDLHKLLTPGQLARLPYSLRILLENIARCAPAALPGCWRGPRGTVPIARCRSSPIG